MALDCVLLLLLASAVAAMEGNVPFAAQLGGCRLPVPGCSALRGAPLTAQGCRASWCPRAKMSRSLGDGARGGTHGYALGRPWAPADGSQSLPALRAPVFPDYTILDISPAQRAWIPLHCGASSSAPGEAGLGRDTSGHWAPRVGTCGSFLSRAWMLWRAVAAASFPPALSLAV